jgi:putative FmdB family regulatory protein
MIYTFACDACNGSFEVNVPISDNQKPLTKPCPLCGKKGKVYRVFDSATHFYSGSVHDQAGNGWKDILRGIKKASGKGNIIDV